MKKICLIVSLMLIVNNAMAQVSPAAQNRAVNGFVQKNSSVAETMLIALRHSLRDDHTRVVLEFNDKVGYTSEFKDGRFRLNITGCRNLVPTNRSNPEGRDISKLDINSGPNRSGLILTFHLKQTKSAPFVEAINDPFRLIISVPMGELAAHSVMTEQNTQVQENKSTSETKTVAPVVAKKEEIELPPEINIIVEPAVLQKKEFLGRSIVIDVGHGGSDIGVSVPGKPTEKNINLSVAVKLKATLEKLGFKAVLNRTSDVELSQANRIKFANKDGGDLYISIHTGGSNDTSKHGIACYYFDPTGLYSNKKTQGAGYDSVFEEWVKSTRFDLAAFLAKKINERLTTHLNVSSRGIIGLPFKPLRFIVNPAVLVEVGMLTDAIDGKNLLSEKYHKAIAESIANAVVDFFNGIVSRQEN